MSRPGAPFPRWPLLSAAVALFGTAVALDLADASGYAYAIGIGGLGSACIGAFVYAEGARHREWTQQERDESRRADDVPSTDDTV